MARGNYLRLHPAKLGLALGLLVALCMLLTSLLAAAGIGTIWVPLIQAFYVGYGLGFGGILLGIIYGFIDGFISGWLLGLFYNQILDHK